MKSKVIYFLISLLIISAFVFYNKTKLTISVIVPVYNAEKYISRCLDSILSQEGDFEVVVINDGSTDSSLKILQEYAKKYKNIKLINQSNQGVSAARNAGLKVASAKYITFVDSDDWLESNAFKSAIDVIKRDKSDVLLTGYYDVYDREWVRKTRGESEAYVVPEISRFPTRSLDKISLFSPFYGKDAHSDLYYVGGGVRARFFKREFIVKNQITFPLGVNCYEDDVFITKAFLSNPFISIDSTPIYNYINRADSISKSKNTLKCGAKSRSAMTSSQEYIKASYRDKMLIDDLFISYVFLSFANYSRHDMPLTEVFNEAKKIYSTFNKYNSKEKSNLRNYIKLENILLSL